VSGGLEPQDLALADARNLWQKLRRRAVDFWGAWLTKTLLGLIASAIAVVAAAVAGALPVMAIVGCALLCVVSVGYAIYARKAMHRERRRRAWIQVEALRQRQRLLELEDSLDVVELALQGSLKDRRGLIGGRMSAIYSALTAYQRRVQELEEELEAARSGSTPDHVARRMKRRERGRQVAASRPYDPGPVNQRRALRDREVATVTAEIQALADEDDRGLAKQLNETKDAERQARDAVAAADRAVRERRRRGLPPTAEPGKEIAIDMQLKPGGPRDVRPRPRLSPEQIARGEHGSDSSSA
jgi:hypothetical protein